MDNTVKYNEPWILQRADPYVYKHTDGKYYFSFEKLGLLLPEINFEDIFL